jgi:hypothetical protein
MGTQFKSAPLVIDHVHVSGFGKRCAGRNTDPGTGFVGSAVLVSCTM